MQIEFLFNLVEGLWWIGLGVWLLRRKQPRIPALSIILFCFGLSDFFEMVTGAWWRPAWLLAYKAVCLTAGLITLILICKERRQVCKPKQEGSPSGGAS